MYRSRREIEPTIPRSADEFCQQIKLTQYGVYCRQSRNQVAGDGAQAALKILCPTKISNRIVF